MGDACQHSHRETAQRPDRVARLLAEAEAKVGAAGQRLTDGRRRVLELLLAVGEPMKAYDLIAQFGVDGRPAKPPTVYRSLDFLEREGLVHRIASISAYVACAGHEGSHAAAFLICDCCGTTQEIPAGVAEPLQQAAREAGYALERTTLEAHGRCPDCRD